MSYRTRRSQPVAQPQKWDDPPVTYTSDSSSTPPQNPTPVAVEEPKKKHRVFLWIFLAIQALFIIWIAVGAGSAPPAEGGGGLSQEEAQEAQDAGTAIGVGLIIALWAAVDIIVGGSYAVYRLATRK